MGYHHVCYFFSLLYCSNEEVYSVVEDAVESTLMNIFVEVTSGEFSINRPLCTIIKSGTN